MIQKKKFLPYQQHKTFCLSLHSSIETLKPMPSVLTVKLSYNSKYPLNNSVRSLKMTYMYCSCREIFSTFQTFPSFPVTVIIANPTKHFFNLFLYSTMKTMKQWPQSCLSSNKNSDWIYKRGIKKLHRM